VVQVPGYALTKLDGGHLNDSLNLGGSILRLHNVAHHDNIESAKYPYDLEAR